MKHVMLFLACMMTLLCLGCELQPQLTPTCAEAAHNFYEKGCSFTLVESNGTINVFSEEEFAVEGCEKHLMPIINSGKANEISCTYFLLDFLNCLYTIKNSSECDSCYDEFMMMSGCEVEDHSIDSPDE